MWGILIVGALSRRDVVVRSVCSISISSVTDSNGGIDSFLYHRTVSVDSDTIDMVFHKGVIIRSRM